MYRPRKTRMKGKLGRPTETKGGGPLHPIGGSSLKGRGLQREDIRRKTGPSKKQTSRLPGGPKLMLRNGPNGRFGRP